MSGIRHDNSAQLCVLLCETIAFPKGTPKGGEKGMVCHWYVTMANKKTAHLPSEVFHAKGSVQLDWCAFLVLDAGAQADVRLTVADLAGNHLGAHFGTTKNLAKSDQFDIRELKLEDVNGVVAVMTCHAASQMRWTSAAAPKREPGAGEFLSPDDAQALHIWKFLFPSKAPPSRGSRSELKPIKEEPESEVVTPQKTQVPEVDEEGEEEAEEEEKEEDEAVAVEDEGDTKQTSAEELRAAKETAERELREREAKEREAKERQAKEREAQERQAKEREAQQRQAKEREAQERQAKEREAQQRQAKEREVREREVKRREAKEKETKEVHRQSGRLSSLRSAEAKGEVKRASASTVSRGSFVQGERLGRREVHGRHSSGLKVAAFPMQPKVDRRDRQWLEESDESDDFHFSDSEGDAPHPAHAGHHIDMKGHVGGHVEKPEGAVRATASLSRRVEQKEPWYQTGSRHRGRWDTLVKRPVKVQGEENGDRSVGLSYTPQATDPLDSVTDATPNVTDSTSFPEQLRQIQQQLHQQQLQLQEQLQLQRQHLNLNQRFESPNQRRRDTNVTKTWRSSRESFDRAPRQGFKVTSPDAASKAEMFSPPDAESALGGAGPPSPSAKLHGTGRHVGGNISQVSPVASLVDKRRLYRVTTRGLGIRAGPNVNAPRTGAVLKRGDIFEASVVAPGADGRIYLKLSGWRGWVFDDAKVDPQDPSVEALTEEEVLKILRSSRLSSNSTGVDNWSIPAAQSEMLQPLVLPRGSEAEVERKQRGDGWSTPSGTPEADKWFLPSRRSTGVEEVVHPSISHEFREAMGGLRRSSP